MLFSSMQSLKYEGAKLHEKTGRRGRYIPFSLKYFSVYLELSYPYFCVFYWVYLTETTKLSIIWYYKYCLLYYSALSLVSMYSMSSKPQNITNYHCFHWKFLYWLRKAFFSFLDQNYFGIRLVVNTALITCYKNPIISLTLPF